MKDKFLVSIEVKKFIDELDSMVVLLPRKEYVLKERIYQDAYAMLELIYIANSVEYKKRVFYQKQILAKISMLDYYLERCFKSHYLSEKQVLKKSRQLHKMNKMIYGWIYGNNTN